MLIHGDGFFNGQNFVETRKTNGTFTYNWERCDDNVSVMYPFNCVYKGVILKLIILQCAINSKRGLEEDVQAKHVKTKKAKTSSTKPKVSTRKQSSHIQYL